MLENMCFTCVSLPAATRALLQGIGTHWALHPWRPPWVPQRSSRGSNCKRRNYPKPHSCPQHPSPTDFLLACLLFTHSWLFLFPPLTFLSFPSIFLAPEPECLPTFHPLELELCIKPDMNPFCHEFSHNWIQTGWSHCSDLGPQTLTAMFCSVKPHP